MKDPKLNVLGREEDGSLALEVAGLPGAPKEIPGLIPRPAPEASRSGLGPKLAPTDLCAGYAITVRTKEVAVVIRATKVRPDAVIGTVERLDSSPPVRDVSGVARGDPVIVRDLLCIHHIGTESQ